MKSFFIYTIIFFLSSPQIFPEAPKGKWSKNFGRMSWYDAKKKCEGIGMRLPTLDELKGAFLDKEMVTWTGDEDGLLWASDTLNDITASSFSWDGYAYTHMSRNAGEEGSGTGTGTRCIRKNFKRIRKSSGVKWSEYQGSMGLEEAMKTCASLKMKLPTIAQFKKGAAVGEFDGWESGLEHWTNDKATNSDKNATNITYSIVWKTYSDVPVPSHEQYHVRCAK